MNLVRVELPAGLSVLARTDREVRLHVESPVTPTRVLDVLERDYPMLLGTIRDQRTGNRRPFIRYFACQQDFSLQSPDTVLPDAVAAGKEPLLVVGAIAGG